MTSAFIDSHGSTPEHAGITAIGCNAARSVRKDVILLCHGGPISMPDDARYILDRCKGLHGFYGASSMERLPAEAAIARQTADFKAVTLGGEKTKPKKKKG